MLSNFYDKVARKFGDYHSSHHKYIAEYPNSDPEKVFKEKLLGLAGKGKIALDVGCADGYFTLSVAPYFKKIMAIDLSRGMLKAAQNLQKEKDIKNVSFEYQDVRKMPYEDLSFDIVYNRRGPQDFPQFFRVLKNGGYYIEIRIGENDARALKNVFGRGQGYGQWSSVLKEDTRKLEKIGFKVIYAKGFSCDEYYPFYSDLDLFLQGVPIFEDFDSEKDRKLLEKYVEKFQTSKGIRLSRHRGVHLLLLFLTLKFPSYYFL